MDYVKYVIILLEISLNKKTKPVPIITTITQLVS